MSTIFDFVTVAAFAILVLAYFTWGRNDQRLLVHLMLPAIAFAAANQLGNHGSEALAALLTLAGAGYAAYAFRR